MTTNDFRINLAWRLLANKKGNFLGSVLAITMGVLLIHVNFVIFDGLWDGLIRDFSGYVYGDMRIRNNEDYITRSDVALVNFLENFPTVESATPRLYAMASMNASKNGKTTEEFKITLVGISPFQDILTSAVHEHVSDEQFISSRSSIVLGQMVARDLGNLQVGDKVDVKIVDRWGNDKIKQFTVSDIASIYGAFGFDTYIHIDTLRDMLGRKGETEAILVKLHDRKDVQEFKKFLANYLHSNEYEIQDVEESAEDVLARVRSGISMIEPIGYFSLTSSGFIIFAIQSMFIRTIVNKIGIIRALGAKRTDILIIFSIQAIIIGAIGAGLGTASGLGFAVLMDNAQFRFGDDVSIPLEINYNLNKIVLTALAALSLSIVGALVPAFFATGISPMEAMRK